MDTGLHKGKCWWFCGVIDHAEQHIQSTECIGNGFVVIVWVSAFDFLRWVAGLAIKRFWDTYGMGIQFSYLPVGGFLGLSTMLNNISKDGRVGVTAS